jgi:hypothetical protein
MQSLERRVYVNDKQKSFLATKAKRRCFQGGRGSGKSTVKGHLDAQRALNLPRAKVFTAGLTYNQVLNITMASAMAMWRFYGLHEYDPKTGMGHYVVCKKPPHHFYKPYQAPRNYKHAITFINGFTIEMLSMDRSDLARGGNYDGGDIDESALMKRDIVFKVLRPMIRANQYRFTHHLHHTFCDYTSVPWLPRGQWVFETEELAKKDPDNYHFVESTAYDNVAVLGERYIENLKAEMSALEYDVEVMNKRLTKLPNSFYHAYNPERHMVFNTYGYDYDDESGLWLTSNVFYHKNSPLETSWDFNAAFTSMIVCQEKGNEFRCIDALYIKEQTEQSKVEALADKFIETYKDQECKEVLIHGDRNGNNHSAGSTKTFYEMIMDRLKAAGWECTLMVQGLDPDHRLKHILINEILEEKNPRMPIIRMHQEKCKFLGISIQNSPITPDWKKDKRSERELIEQERATHLSDCFDNIVYRKYAHLKKVGSTQSYQVYFLG